MPKKHKRSVFQYVNKQQEEILLPYYASFGVTLVCLILLVVVDNPLLSQEGAGDGLWRLAPNKEMFAVFLMGFLAAVIFFTLIYWAYYKTNKMLGAYDRVISELDQVILGNKKGPIKARGKGDFFEELLFRINIFIEKNKDKRERMIDKLIKRTFVNQAEALRGKKARSK